MTILRAAANRRRFVSWAIVLVALTSVVGSGTEVPWIATVSDRVQLAEHAGDLRRVVLTRADRTVACQVFSLDPTHARWSILDHADRTDGVTLAQVRRDRACVVVINGGFFDGESRPVGLLKVDGMSLHALDPKGPSGVLTIDAEGVPRLLPLSEYVAAQPADRCAVQCGPFIIDPGGRPGMRAPDSQRFRRTVLVRGVDGRSHIVIAMSPITLWELSGALLAGTLGIVPERAWTLDGGPSTGFAASTDSGVVGVEPGASPRCFIVVRAQP